MSLICTETLARTTLTSQSTAGGIGPLTESVRASTTYPTTKGRRAMSSQTQAPLYLTDNELEILTDALECAGACADLDATDEEFNELHDRLVMTAALRHPSMEPID